MSISTLSSRVGRDSASDRPEATTSHQPPESATATSVVGVGLTEQDVTRAVELPDSMLWSEVTAVACLPDGQVEPVAACLRAGAGPPDQWYPTTRGPGWDPSGASPMLDQAAALDTCDDCPVRAACLELGLRTDAELGAWGIWGLPASERWQIARARHSEPTLTGRAVRTWAAIPARRRALSKGVSA